MKSSAECLFTEDFEPKSYWWNNQPDWIKKDFPDLPSEVEVVIIGSGYTGLNAGLQTARAGLKTLILDQNSIGWGCSSRNGGQISNDVKPTYKTLCNRYGAEIATGIIDEGQKSVQYMHSLVEEEKFDCQLLNVGRFRGAHNPKMYEWLAKKSKDNSLSNGSNFYMVSKNDLHTELDTNAYYGGAVYPDHCSIDVGKYHSQLTKRVKDAGAILIGNCEVTNYSRIKSGFDVNTTLGTLSARKVILATNGYTGKLSPWYQRRIISIGSYIIATEPISESTLDQLMPKNRVYSDTRKMVYYYRAMPNRKGILFGGRVSLRETDLKKSALRLQTELVRIFPKLSGIKVSRSWMGYVGFSFDKLMHCGHDNGLYYAGGYCGSGVAMASYLGMRLGRQVAEIDDNISAFQKLNFPSRPFYFGNPWFLAPTVMLYQFLDKLNIYGRSN